MAWRKWLVRSVVFALVLAAAGGYYLYCRWTDPSAIRAAVLDQLRERFPGADVQLGSARLQLFGGIRLTDLRLARRDDPAEAPLAFFPAAELLHDKEQLGQGRLVLRKIILKEPKLTVIRRTDGSLNLTGLIAPSDDEPLPVIEVQDGRLTVHDLAADAPPVEVTGLQAVLLPADAGTLRFQVQGRADLLGPFRLQGTADPRTGAVSLAGRLPEVPVNAPLVARLSEYYPDLRTQGTGEGTAAIQGEAAYHPHTGQWGYGLQLHLRLARWQHPESAFPFEDADIRARVEGGRVVLEALTATVAGATLRASGEVQALAVPVDYHLQVSVDRLHVHPGLYEKLPPLLSRFCCQFHPEGNLSVVSTFRRQAGRLQTTHLVRLHGASILYEDFRYPVTDLTGTLDYQDRPGEPPLAKVNLTGQAGGQTVHILGEVFGEGLRPDNTYSTGLRLNISADNLPIDETGLAALPDDIEALVRQFRPAGRVSVLAEIRRRAGDALQEQPPLDDRYVVRIHGASLCYEKFRYPVEAAEGTLEVLPDGSWRLDGFRAQHKGGVFTGRAEGRPAPGGDRVTVAIRGTGVLLDEELKQALNEQLQTAWAVVRPSGRVDFQVQLTGTGRETLDLDDLQVTARDCVICPTFFPYRLSGVTGALRCARNQVVLGEFQAWHGGTLIRLGRDGYGGRVVLDAGGGYRVELRRLWAEALPVNDELLNALPGGVRAVFAALRPDQPIRLVTDLVVVSPAGGPADCCWDGHAAFANCRLHAGVELNNVTGVVACWGSHAGGVLTADGNVQIDQATLFRQPLRAFGGRFQVRDGSLRFPEVTAQMHGGEVYGPVRVDFADGLSYRVELTVSQVDLEKFARQTLRRSGQVQGKAYARLELSGRGEDIASLRGTGSVSVPEGRLYDLPLLLDLLTTLSGHLPKGAAFQEVHTEFTIQGKQLQVTKLELLGDAICLRGLGRMNLDGSGLDLEMHGLFMGKTLPLFPPVINQIPPALSQLLMKIHVRGSLDDVQTKTQPVPIVTEPLKDLGHTLAGRRADPAPPPPPAAASQNPPAFAPFAPRGPGP